MVVYGGEWRVMRREMGGVESNEEHPKWGYSGGEFVVRFVYISRERRMYSRWLLW